MEKNNLQKIMIEWENADRAKSNLIWMNMNMQKYMPPFILEENKTTFTVQDKKQYSQVKRFAGMCGGKVVKENV